MEEEVRIRLQGIDCMECAYRIEESLKKSGFDVSFNVAKSEISVRKKDLEAVRKIIKEVEPEVEFVEDFEGAEEGISRKRVLAIIASLILFSSAFLINYFTPERLLSATLFVSSYLMVGWDVIIRAFRNVVRGRPFDENFLLTLATLGAFIIGEYPEATAVMLFYNVGDFLQGVALNRSRNAIKAILSIKADYANLKVGDGIVKVNPEEVKVGGIIIVRLGEKIPLDGKVISGRSLLDTSALTGESMPLEVKEGDTVLSGMVNLRGLLKVKVEKEYKESTVSKILELIESAASRKARTERFISRFSRYYTPVVILLSLSISLLPPLMFGGDFVEWVYRGLILLVISCPCALVLSIPLTYFGALGRSAREGILVKGSNFLDSLSRLSVIALDKTGTLTEGRFKVVEVVPKNGFSEEDVLRYAAIAESQSNHPLAKAIRNAYLVSSEDVVEDYQEVPGHGVFARIGDDFVMVGNDRMLHTQNVPHDLCEVEGTVAHVVVNGKYAGYIVVSDEIKEGVAEALKDVKSLGVKRLVMLTGDNKYMAKRIAEELNIDDYYADLLPDDKIRVIEELMESEGKEGVVAFVGDGVNDAPVIARADVGIAMGALDSDAAIEIADVVIADDKLTKVPKVIRIARKTKKILWENISLTLGG
ncbi:MAG: heavy metal translocating P-type ATPase [Candidatus Asgardarchaeia archaeon]